MQGSGFPFQIQRGWKHSSTAPACEVIAGDHVGRANQILKIIKLTRGAHEQVVYVYNFSGLNYYFFPNLLDMVQFFDEGKEPEHVFSSDRELDMFLKFF